MPRQILVVVEDELTYREVAEVILKGQGYEVLLASTGQEAIEVVHRTLPDRIVMDSLMPVLDGLSATRVLKSDPRTAQFPLLVVTAKASHADRDAAEAAGFDGYIAKPYRNMSLVAAVRSLLPVLPSLP